MIEIHLSQKICGARWCHFVKIRMPNLDAPRVYEFTDDFATHLAKVYLEGSYMVDRLLQMPQSSLQVGGWDWIGGVDGGFD